MKYNIYCDESCHLENDGNDIFVVGGLTCPQDKANKINSQIISIKESFNYKKESEIKWTKISNGNLDFYLALVDYFFNNPDLTFRGYIGRGKTELSHNAYSQTYDDWYYKMYYRMLEFILDNKSKDTFNIFLDIKDTLGSKKISVIKSYFNHHYSKNIVSHIQLVRSDEVAILQLTDLLIGALSYAHRCLESSTAKLNVISYIEKRSQQNLLLSSSYTEKKANWFVWVPDHWR